MSYDLYFWRQTEGFSKGPEEVMKLVSEDEPVDGLVSFPRASVRKILRDAFPEIQDGDFELTWEGAGSYF